MFFDVGDYVTRDSHNNDLLFQIVDIKDNLVYLKGVDVRLYADSEIEDLRKATPKGFEKTDEDLIERVSGSIHLDRDEYFYLPGKILHIDGDQDYLKRCMEFYKKMKLQAFGIVSKEEDIASDMVSYLNKVQPDIVVITGHDAYYKRKGSSNDLSNYKNSLHFRNAILKAREYEKSQDKLIVVAGACQSDYEALIKAGANFASSPKRINIHALDPAIIAASVALSEKNKNIDLLSMIEKTKYGSEGIGGIITSGTMYVGYPR